MSNERRVALWAYAAQFSGISLNVFLLPLIVRLFPIEKVALWYLFLTIGSLGALAEQCLEPAITRYVTYARNGVRRLPKYGERPRDACGVIDPVLTRTVIGAARWLHVRTSAINILLFGAGGSVYLWHLASPEGLASETLRAWTVFSVAQYAGCRLMVNIPILQGLGRTHEALQSLALQRTAFLLCAIVGIWYAPRLEVIGVAQLAANLLGLGLAKMRVQRAAAAIGITGTATAIDLRPCVQEMLRGSSRLWATRFGAFQITKSCLLLVSSFIGLQAAGSLALSMQAMETINLLAMTPLFSRLPRLYELRTLERISEMKANIGNSLLVAWTTFSAGSLVVLLYGSSLLQLIGSRSTFLPTDTLALLLITGLLEMNHSFCATLLLLDNRVPFMKAALLSGGAIVGLSSLVMYTTSWGVLGALAVPFLVQLMYNNWKWPMEALKLLDTSYRELARLGIAWRP